MSDQDGAPIVEARVKWFSAAKGFGFVAPIDGSPDAFLHVATLEAAGMAAPVEGATILCQLVPGKKGPQVARVVRGNAPGAGAAAPKPAYDVLSESDGIDVVCRVRWYCSVRNYGFLTPEDGSTDVFVNGATLRRSRVLSLDEGQQVASKVVTAARGREARAIRIL